MKTIISCEDKYEAQKLASLILSKKQRRHTSHQFLNIIKNELVILLKDKSTTVFY